MNDDDVARAQVAREDKGDTCIGGAEGVYYISWGVRESAREMLGKSEARKIVLERTFIIKTGWG